MFFDVDNSPIEPPAECRRRLLWRLARALWEAHRPDSASFCVVAGCWHENQRNPCRLAQLAQEGMRTACGDTTPASPPWIAVASERLAAGHIDLVDAVAELLWRHSHSRSAGRRPVGIIYTSTAFREYAKAQVAYANILLIKHAELGLSLCRCGRLHPCDDRQHWLRMRAHFGQFLIDEQYSSEVQQPSRPNPTRSDPNRPDDLA